MLTFTLKSMGKCNFKYIFMTSNFSKFLLIKRFKNFPFFEYAKIIRNLHTYFQKIFFLNIHKGQTTP